VPADAVALETEFSQVQVAWLVLMFHCPTFTTNLAWQGWPRQSLLLEERHFGYPSKARKSLPKYKLRMGTNHTLLSTY